MTKLYQPETYELTGRRKCNLIQSVITIALFCIAMTVPGQAQSMQGAIVGTVQDSSGAIVPGATVAVTNTDTNVTKTLTTDSSGSYQVLNLTAGHYAVHVTASGFKDEVEGDLLLLARQQLRANVTLQVGSVSQQVTVNGQSAGAIESETPSISAALSAEDVKSLPANYRGSGSSPLDLISTLPGVQTGSGDFSVQGGLPSQMDVTVDGITSQSTFSNYPIGNAFPSGETISEIRVDGVLNNAEFGQPGEVTSVSKNGTNTLHGAAFWYFQNSGFDATPFGSTSKPKLVGNDFGGTLGGPVVIPHLYNGHNKTFFFGTYEGFRQPNQSTYQDIVPTAAMKQGDFSQVVGIQPLTNPFTGGTYSNYTVPINSVSQNFLQFFPDPNVGNVNSYNESVNYITNKDSSYSSNQYDIRIDQYLGQKALIYGRFTWKNISANQPKPLAFPSSTGQTQERIFVIAGDYNFTPKLLNEFRFGLTNENSGSTNNFNGEAFAQSSGLQGLQDLRFNGVSEFDFRYLSSFDPDRLDPIYKSHTYQYLDSLTWSLGHHNFKFGGDIRRLLAAQPNGVYGADQYGTFGFNTGTTFTGQEFADFLIGTPQTTGYDVSKDDVDGLSNHYAFYAQDEWKASPRLNVFYGIRYEYQPGFHDVYGNIGNFDPSVPLSGRVYYPDNGASLVSTSFLASFNGCGIGLSTGVPAANGAPCTPVLSNSQAGLPSSLKTVPKLRFMPRVGFAFRPFNDDKTAIRAGFGMFNITQLGSAFYSLEGALQNTANQYTNSETPNGPAYSFPNIYAGTPAAPAPIGTAYFGTANDIHYKNPYSEQFSLSLDHEFGSGYGVRLSYIGMETHQLIWAPNLNDLRYSNTVSAYDQPLTARPFPNWGLINNRAAGANSSYHSLQIEALHRFTSGFSFDSTYTFSKNLADNQGANDTDFAGETGGARSSYAYDREIDFGNVYGNRRNRWNTTSVYQLPVGRGKRFGAHMNRVADALIGGWQVSNIFLYQSGPFISAYFPVGMMDPSGTGSGLAYSRIGGYYGNRVQKPDRISTVSLVPHGQNRNNWINRAALACPGQSVGYALGSTCNVGSGQPGAPLPIGRFGNAQIGSIVGPGTVNLSSGLSKTFPITERVHLRAEGTFTNVLNHSILADPTLDLTSPQFGQITSARGDDFGGSRTGQVSMRLEF